MGWRDYLGATQVEKKELKELNVRKAELIPLIPLIPPPPAGNSTPFHECLTEVEREIWVEHVRWSIENGTTQERAEVEATEYICQTRTKNVLHTQQAAADYRRRGWVQIWSTVIGRAVYMAKTAEFAKAVPDKTIPVYLESDVLACKGLNREEAKPLLEAKLILGGRFKWN